MTANSEFASLASSSLPSLRGNDVWQTTGTNSSSSASVDLSRLQRLSQSLQLPTSSPANTNVASPVVQQFGSLDEMLRQRQFEIMDEILSSEVEESRRISDKLRSDRLHQNWVKERETYLKEVIDGRRLGGASKVPKGMNAPAAPKSGTSQLNLQSVAQAHIALIAQWNANPRYPLVGELMRMATKFPAYGVGLKLAQCLKQGDSSSALGRALATLHHLATQYQSLIINRVQAASLTGSAIGETSYHGMAKTISIFVKLQLGSASNHWPIVYFCLRCGDACAALHVLENTEQDGHPIRDCVGAFAQQQGEAPCFWERKAPLLRTTKHHRPSNDPYETACWSLLSGETALSTEKVVEKVEDYVYISLWHAVCSDNVEAQIQNLGTSFESLGPQHFDEGGSASGWSYAQPLMLVQRYGPALKYLGKSGDEGLLQATHAALVWPGLDPELLTSLVVEFSIKLQFADASAALDYLVHIPNDQIRTKEVARLIVETRRFTELVGTISADGVRQGRDAALDKSFSRDSVSKILAAAADLAHQNKNLRDALELLNLAERYDSLVSMLNEHLVELVNGNPDAERKFWIDAAQQFDSWHFGDKRTQAKKVLESTNKLRLVETFHMLLRLCHFFDRLHVHDFKEAWSTIDNLYLLPSSPDQMDAKTKTLDPILLKVADDLLLGAFEALYQQFVRLKHSGVITDISTVQGRLLELQKRARLMCVFAERLRVKPETISRMASMEAQML